MIASTCVLKFSLASRCTPTFKYFLKDHPKSNARPLHNLMIVPLCQPLKFILDSSDNAHDCVNRRANPLTVHPTYYGIVRFEKSHTIDLAIDKVEDKFLSHRLLTNTYDSRLPAITKIGDRIYTFPKSKFQQIWRFDPSAAGAISTFQELCYKFWILPVVTIVVNHS